MKRGCRGEIQYKMYSVTVFTAIALRAPFIQTKCLFEIYANVGLRIRCLYSAVSLTLMREQRFIRTYYCYDDVDDD